MITACNSTAAITEGDCSICFESLTNKRIIALHPCLHRFHHTCILRWFEAAENFATAEARCSLCRTVADRRMDEKGQRVPIIFPMEEKGEEVDIDEVDLTDLVSIWTAMSGIIDGLDEDRISALRNGKSDEYVNDIIEEMNKLSKRQDATELLFVTIIINKDELIKSLKYEVDCRKEALGTEVQDGIRTRALARRRRVLEKELAVAKKEFKDEVNATVKDAQEAFKELCTVELAAVAEVAAKNAAAIAAASAPGPSTTVPAKRRMQADNYAEERQTKRRR